MKPLMAGALLLGAMMFGSAVSAQTASRAPDEDATARRAANEAAGLPDLDEVNRRADARHATVELNSQRAPSFYTRDAGGTSVTEFRDRGRAPEIDVRSGFGTRYQMSAPADISPRVQNSGSPNAVQRVPSIHLSY